MPLHAFPKSIKHGSLYFPLPFLFSLVGGALVVLTWSLGPTLTCPIQNSFCVGASDFFRPPSGLTLLMCNSIDFCWQLYFSLHFMSVKLFFPILANKIILSSPYIMLPRCSDFCLWCFCLQ